MSESNDSYAAFSAYFSRLEPSKKEKKGEKEKIIPTCFCAGDMAG
jgi:hypothetical protein